MYSRVKNQFLCYLVYITFSLNWTFSGNDISRYVKNCSCKKIDVGRIPYCYLSVADYFESAKKMTSCVTHFLNGPFSKPLVLIAKYLDIFWSGQNNTVRFLSKISKKKESNELWFQLKLNHVSIHFTIDLIKKSFS